MKKALLSLLITLLILAPAGAQSSILNQTVAIPNDNSVCDFITERLPWDEIDETFAYPDGWDIVNWDNVAQGTRWLIPASFDASANPEESAYYYVYQDPIANKLYLGFAFDLEYGGNPPGTHHICPQLWSINLK